MARARSKKKRGASAKRSGTFARLSRAFGALFFGREDDEASDRWSEIGGICLIGFAIWLIVSMASFYVPFDDPAAEGHNWGGQIGHVLADGVFRAVGLGGYLLAFLGLAWGAVLVGRKEIRWASVRLFGALCCVLAIAFLFEMTFGGSWDPNSRLPYGPGGWLALNATAELEPKVGRAGLWIMMPAVALVSFMLATEMAFYPALVAFREWAEERRDQRGESLGRALFLWTRELLRGLWDFVRGVGLDEEPAPKPKRRKKAPAPPEPLDDEYDDGEYDEADDEYEEDGEYEDEDEEYDDEEEAEYDDDEWDEDEEEYEDEEDDVLEPVSAKERVKAALHKPKQRSLDFEPPVPEKGDWKYPPLDLLGDPDTSAIGSEKQVEDAATKLENALTSFRVEAQVVGAQIGPTVTLFELEVAQGTRLNKVTQLSQEIAAALRAKSVRIIAPIPGKATIGIEVPNEKRRLVRLWPSSSRPEAPTTSKFAALPLFLGMDAEGTAIVEDLARMPHLLIAGTTGSGKSVCINTILASLLLTRSPHDVQLILVDPKMVELQMFSEVPHMMLPVVNDMTAGDQRPPLGGGEDERAL